MHYSHPHYYISQNPSFDIERFTKTMLVLIVLAPILMSLVQGVTSLGEAPLSGASRSTVRYTDEDLHTYFSARMTAATAHTTGSLLIGQTVARTIGYLKETSDLLLGKDWSNDDIQANETGIQSI